MNKPQISTLSHFHVLISLNLPTGFPQNFQHSLNLDPSSFMRNFFPKDYFGKKVLRSCV